MPFEFARLAIPDLVRIEPRVFLDERGEFMETYKRSEFSAFGLPDDFVQENQSRSTRGVLRGLHYQTPPHAQGKLVRVVAGEIFDVAVDIRAGSPSWGHWVGELLSGGNRRMLYVPPGFAHGFCVLSQIADVVYKTTNEYAPASEAGVLWNDPDLGIPWPIKTPIVSSRDARLPRLRQLRSPFGYDGEGCREAGHDGDQGQ